MLLFSGIGAYAQQAAMITGKVTDEKGQAVELVNVSILGYPGGTSTAADGSYSLQIPAAREVKSFFHLSALKQIPPT
ncbi:MAG: hypothetical protein U0Z17_09355 [Bacteroidales bacterium]